METNPRPEEVPSFLALLAHPQRWRLLEALARSDRRVNELVSAVKAPPNLVSYHLRKLRERQLVHERRSSADGRDVYYSLDLGRLRQLYSEAAQSLHPGLAEPEMLVGKPRGKARRWRVLFLCTHNSARSQMAEGILRALGGDRFEVASAGTEPSRVHPLALKTMARRGIDIGGHRSKHMDEFAQQRFDYVITVCDLASEACPVFPGAPERIHWSIADPAGGEGTEKSRLDAFEKAADNLAARIRFLVTLCERKGLP